MTEFKYASWVKGEYLYWVKDEQYSNKCFHELNIHTFLTREDSKPKLKTLHAIAESIQSPTFSGMEALDIADCILDQIEHYYQPPGAAQKKELTSALKQFRKATNNLFEALGYIHSSNAHHLIKGAPAMLGSKADLTNMDEHKRELTKALKVFWDKSAHQVLLEYADQIESLGTGNPHFLVNNRPPTESQARVRLAVYLIISMIGIEATRGLTGLAPLIATLVDLTFEDKDPLCPRDVKKQIRTAIALCETHGILFRGE